MQFLINCYTEIVFITKTNMNKHRLFGSIVLLVPLVAIGLFVIGQDSTLQPTPDITVTELPRSNTDETTPKADTSSTAAATPEPSTTEQPYNPPKESTPTQRKEIVKNSPKQTEIRSSTEVERIYYPLRIPNDPGYDLSNWSLTHMNAPAAWDITTGSADTTVAVLDSGFSLDHEDLATTWFTNSGEQGNTTLGDICWLGVPQNKATNNCDDDQNGYIDDWRGWDFFNGTNDPAAGQDNPTGDAVGHGTEVAGLVGASGNNGIGIATLSWSTKLLPLKVLSDDGPGYSSDIAAAIYYAVDLGVDVINLSLGGNESDPTLLAATDYAYEQGVVVIAAAGNCGTGTGESCSGYPQGIIGYPARNPNVIAVGATTNSKQRASFSSYGTALDVVAPGSGSIYSPTYTATNPTSLYATTLYGTSFASPYVASLAALIKSIRPASSVDDITAILLGTAQKTNIANGLYSNDLGHGIVNAEQALVVASSLNATSDIPVLFQTGGHKSEHTYTVNTTMASGCKSLQPTSYCTVRFQNSVGYDRLLPYKLTGEDNYTSWSWNSSLLSGDSWWLRAVQGDAMSADYLLSLK